MNRFLLWFLMALPLEILAQSANIPVNRDYYHMLDRYEIMSGEFSKTFHGHVRPLQRSFVGAFVDSLYADQNFTSDLSERDLFNLQYLATDSWEWSESDTSDSRKPFLKYIFRGTRVSPFCSICPMSLLISRRCSNSLRSRLGS